ncbi:molybdenum cofactor biosynthesis protein [Paenibacillus fonticola]|uniref:molybdenum cofactor biosynthesis protein n=1 Tax=Paenibacillus fonticola TaxID=379896 RepID=UPI00035C3A6D|nr:molybdenum cofactor biosynthesis protein MoaE [Paenibacillus fonticola]
MKLTIYLFAGLADRIGTSRLELTYGDNAVTADQLKRFIAGLYPDAASLINISFLAVNQEYAAGDLVITEQDEIALIPPVSGGKGDSSSSSFHSQCNMYTITSLALSVDEVTSKVNTANHGATLVFVGTTREMTGSQRTIHLEYEAYIPMALSKMEQIGEEIAASWPGTKCAISHRIGQVNIAESSVIIAVSTPHRNDSYEASRYAIERLKQIVPIWKKEIWEDGTEWKGHGQGPWDPSAPGQISHKEHL